MKMVHIEKHTKERERERARKKIGREESSFEACVHHMCAPHLVGAERGRGAHQQRRQRHVHGRARQPLARAAAG